jgi:hypothetical protein
LAAILFIALVHGLQAGVLHEDDRVLALRAEVRALQGHAVRAGGSLQAGPGHGLLPRAVLPDALPHRQFL